MLDERDLQAIAQIMDKKLEPIQEELVQVKEDLTQVKEDLAQLKEDHEITRDALNYLCGWADKVGGTISFPLPKP